MKLILCIDKKNGMQFGGRRQSRDSAVCARILEMSENSRLWLNQHSRKLFGENVGHIRVDEDFLSCAGSSEYCFVENSDFLTYLDRVEEIIIFRWERIYPADMHFPVELLKNWVKEKTDVFSGSSHDAITLEVYLRESKKTKND